MRRCPWIQLFFAWALFSLFAGTAAAQQSVKFGLHKFEQLIGEETDVFQRTGKTVDLQSTFKFTDRGTPVPLKATLRFASGYRPLAFTMAGSTSRSSNIDLAVMVNGSEAEIRDGKSKRTARLPPRFFTISGYAPAALEEALMRYWLKNGKPASLPTLPSGSVEIIARGIDTFDLAGRPVKFERYRVRGLVWGLEAVWFDTHNQLAAVITRDAEFDHFEAIREPYEAALSRFVAAAASDEIASLAELNRNLPGRRNGPFAFTGATLISGTGGTIPDSVVVTRNGKITATGPASSVQIPTDAQRVDVTGKFIIPGLWDMHAHYEQVEWGPIYLAAGVTTVRDVGNEFEFITAIRDRNNSGGGVGPHMLLAGVVDGDGPLALGIQRVNSAQDAADWVLKYHKAGFQQIKIYSSVKLDIIQDVCRQAHALGMTVTGHIPVGVSLNEGVSAGMDQVNHITFVMAALVPRDFDWSKSTPAEKQSAVEAFTPNSPRGKDLIAFLKQHGTVIDDTAAIFELFGGAGSREPGIVNVAPELREQFGSGDPPAPSPLQKRQWQNTIDMIGALHRAAVPLRPFQFDSVERILQRAGQPVLITPKALRVLLVLVRRAGHLVTKDDLMQEVWPRTFVEANNLAFNISLLRKALGEDSASPGFIETVPKRGYRFIASVTELPASDDSLERAPPPEASAPTPTGFPFRNASHLTVIAGALALVAALVIGIGMLVSERSRVSEPKVRQITTNSEDNPVEHAVISPDGKYIAYGDFSGIQVQSIGTGEVHLLPRPESISAGDLWFPAGWSADGSKIFATSITSRTTAAWRISLLGGQATLLRENASLRSVSPDGSKLAFLRSSVPNQVENVVNRRLIRAAEIWVMGPNGEDARLVPASNNSTYLGSVSWSPHGSRIAFQRFTRKGPETILYTIETTDLLGTSPRTVFEESHYGSFSVDHNFPNDLCWLNDGRLVYSLQEPPPRIRDSNLWTVHLDEDTGQRRGEPARLCDLAGFHMEGLSATADGKRVLFESSRDQSYVYVARLAPNGHLIEGRRLTPNERYNTPSGWTSDSRAVLFRSDRTGSFALYKQDVDSQLPELIPTGPGSPGFPRISPDGNWVIYPVGVYPEINRLMRVPITGGAPQVIVEKFDNSGPGDCPRRPGLPCLNFEPSSDGKQDIFFNYDPLTGSRSEAFRTARKTTSMVVSPDGSLVAAICMEPAGAIEDQVAFGRAEADD